MDAAALRAPIWYENKNDIAAVSVVVPAIPGCYRVRNRGDVTGPKNTPQRSSQVRSDCFAKRCERKAVAMYEFTAELLLKSFDSVAQRRLRYATLLGCASEIAAVTERQEVSDLRNLHPDLATSRRHGDTVT